MTILDKLLSKALAARDKAYAPYSNFHVGSCLITKSGHFYAGCNIENASYSLTQCAESSAIAAMTMAGERDIQDILVVGNTTQILTPCGACRQRIREFGHSHTRVHLCAENVIKKTMTLDELLPASFGPEVLECS